MRPGVDYVFTPRIVSQSTLQALNDVSRMEMISSLITASSNGVMFTNHSEHPIHIRRCKQFGRAQVLIFGDKIHQTKKVVE